MNVLGFDTSTAATSACVLRSDGQAFELRPAPAALFRGAGPASELLPARGGRARAGRARLAAAGRDRVWGVGPGAFTGLRIGIATARALVERPGAGPAAVSCWRRWQPGSDAPLALPLVDARRGQLFGPRLTEPRRALGPVRRTRRRSVERSAHGGWRPACGRGGSITIRELLDSAGIRVAPEWLGLTCVSALQVCQTGRGGSGAGDGVRPPRVPATRTPSHEANERSARDDRRLTYADRRRSSRRSAAPSRLPGRWRLFVLELSKQSGICLAAHALNDTHRGYLICRATTTVWHLRRGRWDKPVAPPRHRDGANRAAVELADRAPRAVHLEVRTSQRAAIKLLRGLRLPQRGAQAGYLPRQNREGRPDHVAHGAGPRRQRVILAIETSCDDTCAAVVSEDGELRSNVLASQGLLHARLRRGGARVASRRHLELVDAVTAVAPSRAPAPGLGDVDTVAVTPRPRPDRSGWGGVLGEGPGRGAAPAAGAGGPPARPRGGQHLGPEPRAKRPAGRARRIPYPGSVPVPCGQTAATIFLARVDDLPPTPCSARRWRRRRRGVRQGARLLGAGLSGRARARPPLPRGRPEAFAFPRSAPRRADFSFAG